MTQIEMLFPDRQRRPYYIVAPAYVRFSAGIKVLHQLCHLLNLKGQSAFMVTSGVNPDLATPLLTEKIIDYHFQTQRTPIVVYPEVMHGNPLQAKCVVRYLLNLPGLQGGPSEFPPEDLLLWYSEEYRDTAKGSGPVLSLPSTDARFFHPPPPGTKRSGSCFYAAKFRHFKCGPMLPITDSSIEIVRTGPRIQTPEEILSLFQKSEVFYCYESSALVLEAILCGCPAVLLPNKHMDKLITCGPLGKAGIAWGMSEEELNHARNTVGEMRGRFEKFLEIAFEQLDKFINYTQGKARAIVCEKKVSLIDPFTPPPPPPDGPFKKGLKLVVPQGTRHALRKVITGLSP